MADFSGGFRIYQRKQNFRVILRRNYAGGGKTIQKYSGYGYRHFGVFSNAGGSGSLAITNFCAPYDQPVPASFLP